MPVQKTPYNVSTDPAFQVYLKLSGVEVLVWMGMLLTGPA